MKAYQLKLCVRGNPAVMQTVIVEADDYKLAMVSALQKLSAANNVPIEQLAVQEIYVIEAYPYTKACKDACDAINAYEAEKAAAEKAADTVDILRVDEPIKKTLGQIEYERRMAARIVNCEKCNYAVGRHDGQRIYKAKTGLTVYFYGNGDQMPDGWGGITCQCGAYVPGIEFDEFDHEAGKQYPQ